MNDKMEFATETQSWGEGEKQRNRYSSLAQASGLDANQYNFDKRDYIWDSNIPSDVGVYYADDSDKLASWTYGVDPRLFGGNEVFGVDLAIINDYTHKLSQNKVYYEVLGDVLQKNLKDLATNGFSGAICSSLDLSATKARNIIAELTDLMQRSKDFINTEVAEGSQSADAQAAAEMASILGEGGTPSGHGGSGSATIN